MNQDYNAQQAQGNQNKYPLALPAGTIVGGKYIIGRVLGQGGFGITYSAQDYQTKELVAIKEYFPDTLVTRTNTCTVSSHSGERELNFAYGKQCFLQEAQTLAAFIGNSNIVRIFNYFEENNTAYFAMEYIEGKSLKQVIEESGGKLGWEKIKKTLLPIMDALSAVHARGIIHRDISPDNIFITNTGEIKLLDFGAARYSLGDRSRSLDVVLKHGYAPKEQYTRHGKQGPYTDIYSLGATFYKALTGRIPPDSIDRMEDDDLILPSTLGSDVPQYAEMAIVKALAVQPADRFQSMVDFKRALTTPGVMPVNTVAQQTVPIQAVVNTGTVYAGDMPSVTIGAFPAQAVQPSEDKPEMVFVILSILIPFVGIVMFFKSRKTKPKAALAYGIPAVIRIIILVAISVIVGSWGVEFSKQKYGTTSGDTYTNEYFNVSYTLPKDFTFLNKDERLEIDDSYSVSEDNPEILYNNYGDYIDYWDSRADSKETASRIITEVEEKILQEAYPDIESYLKEKSEDEAFEDTYKSNVSEVYEKTIGSNTFKCCTVTFYSNLLGKDYIYESYYVIEKNGNYLCICIIDDDGDDKDTTGEYFEEYFKTFK